MRFDSRLSNAVQIVHPLKSDSPAFVVYKVKGRISRPFTL